jgi:flagellar basal-body rod modification protein FlgD
MTSNGNAIGGAGVAGLNPALTSTPQTTTAKKNDQLGKNEFLTLLITQLKNQDPEQPVDSKEFATQLAQFTQVERLISIDEKLGARPGDISSVAGYLGQQVTLDGSTVSVKGGQGGQLALDMSQDASEVTVQLLSSTGEVVSEKSFESIPAGKQSVNLEGLSVPDGEYGIRVSALSSRGTGTFTPNVSLTGLVTGFIPGPDPKLIVDGREVAVSSVRQVMSPPKAPAVG